MLNKVDPLKINGKITFQIEFQRWNANVDNDCKSNKINDTEVPIKQNQLVNKHNFFNIMNVDDKFYSAERESAFCFRFSIYTLNNIGIEVPLMIPKVSTIFI